MQPPPLVGCSCGYGIQARGKRMGQNSGFILLHRKLREHFLWQDKPFSKGQAWIDMLLLANHSDNEVLYGNQITEINRGSFIRSERQLAASWGWSRKRVQTFLVLLEKGTMIAKKRDQKASHITILNYDKYQISRTSEGTSNGEKRDHDGATMEPKQIMIKNEKEEEKESLSSDNQVPHKAIIRLYHEILPEFPSIKIWSPERQRALRARWKEDKDRQNLDWWKGLFEYVRNSDFLMGNNDRKWRPNLEWLIKKNKFVNLIEGTFHEG
jgi:hypothetical protein